MLGHFYCLIWRFLGQNQSIIFDQYESAILTNKQALSYYLVIMSGH